ncbi:amino acid ABC transporter substrate-binding protein [Nocardioides aromaticivorans]|uniref:Amino acid ABC transporter substrate-binding protein n=1 Tax=Nocardioides aromaticivorans TaxID=200618 RepID=A0ABX7PEM5_9ACTN|nr:ABC transporter substrate-binding protein [Nocardioides aromaticivorans]QSR24212.1 amino acid ABC transporter substrate-binding protein [Nocardioides aromaticivorans]
MTTLRRSTRILVALTAAAALSLTACSSDDSSSSAEDGELATLTPGKLTIATGDPSYSPWVEDDDPESGKGFEAAVAYAVAEELGFDKADVTWVRTTFDAAIAPGPKDFDFNLQQFSITDERKKGVDFSSPYYTTVPALVSVKGNKGADATDIAGVKDSLIGVATGTTTLKAVEDLVDPSQDVKIFNSNEDAVQALTSGQIDLLAVDLPTAFYLSSAELDDGVVVGQLDTTEGGDQFGLVLPKDSELTDAVTDAVDALREDGTLDQLAQEWLADAVDAPVLK